MKDFPGIAPAAIFTGLVTGIGLPSCQFNNLKKDTLSKMNVVVLIGDDHASTAVHCYGNEIIRTPSIDRLAEEGVMFTNAYSNAPVCSASRQSLLCGKYPHSTGVTLLQTAFRDEGNITLAEVFRDNGYKTCVVGKTHFNNYRDSIPPDHGFDIFIEHSERKKYLADNPGRPVPDSIEVQGPWKPFRDPARIWLNADVLPVKEWSEDGSAAWDADHAISFMEENSDKPFLLWVGFHEPHSPFPFPVDYAGKYNPEDMPVPEGSPEDDRFVPEIFRDLSYEDKQGIIASYYTSAEYMDANIGRILDALDSLGIRENTLVIYLGDQGYLLGDHKRFEKHSMWEEASKAPLIISNGINRNAASKSDALVQFTDIMPTILELCNMEIPGDVTGKSLVPILEGSAGEVNDYVFSEFLVDNKAMITDGKWKYVFTTGQRDLGQGYATGYGPSGILHKLYDLENDPKETRNLAALPGYHEILMKLQAEMLKLFRETHPGSKEIPEDIAEEEQLIRFCEPPDLNANINGI